MKLFYFIRHGQTKYNVTNKFVGSTDLPLTEDGIKNIKEIWDEKRVHLDHEVLYCSPMKRCIETASIIFPGENINTVKNFREMDFGIFEGKNHEQLEHLDAYKEFRETKGKSKVPKGESGIEFGRRVLKGFFEIVKDMNKNDYNVASIVCHGGVIMALFSLLCDESNDIYHYYLLNGEGYSVYYDEDLKRIIINGKL